MIKKVALSLAIGLTTTKVLAQTPIDISANPNGSAYIQDHRGTVVRAQSGLCWRTGSWTSTDAIAGCDGELVPPITKPTAPDIAPPTLAEKQAPSPFIPKRCDFTVSLSNDQTFEFNKIVLNTVAKKYIDEEVWRRLAACEKVESVLITGHTDQLGSVQYNQKLSEKRAELVTSYLKNKDSSLQIVTMGVGETQPVKSCDNNLAHGKLIDCLSPNRRVTIEIRGIEK